MKQILAILLTLLALPSFAANTAPVTTVKITGGDETLKADVYPVNGKNRLSVDATQGGTWTMGRTWALLNSTDSVNAVQSGIWTIGRTWTLSNSTDSLVAYQGSTWTMQQGSTPTSIGNAWPFKLTNGTDVTAVKAASTAAVASDPSAVVALSPNSPVPSGTNSIGSIQNVSGTVSLPTGASTSALQVSGNSSLSSIDTKTPTQGQALMVASSPVVIASNQSAIPVTQSTSPWIVGGSIAVTDVAPANGSITAFDAGSSSLVGANGQTFYVGSPTAGSSANFTLASVNMVSVQVNLLGAGGTIVVEVSADGGSTWLRPNVYQPSTQSYTNGFTSPFVAVLNVSAMTNLRVRGLTSWAGTGTVIVKETLNNRAVTIADALPTGANTIGSIANVSGTVSLPTGASTASNQATIISSLSTIDAGIPAALGATTSANSMPVVLATDSANLNFGTKVALTANSPANVSVGVTSGACLASNSIRKGAIFTNVSINRISMAIGTAAVLNSGITLYPGGTWVMDEYNFTTGAINCIASVAASGIGVQEFQ